MKKFISLILLIICFGTISACAFLNEKATPGLAKAVDRYCEEVPKGVRGETRQAINALTEKGDISVTCVGD